MSDALIAEVRKKSSSLSDPHMILFCEKTRPLCFCVCVSECSIGYIDRIDIDAVNILAHAVNILALLSDLLELLSDLLELIFPTERTALNAAFKLEPGDDHLKCCCLKSLHVRTFKSLHVGRLHISNIKWTEASPSTLEQHECTASRT